MNKFINITIFIVFFAVVAALFYLVIYKKAPVAEVVEKNEFIKSGTLVMNNPGLKPDTWYLVYEEPGKPAVNVAIDFDGKSECRRAGISEICGQMEFENGDQAMVEGITQINGAVLVRNLSVESREAKTKDILLYFYNPEADKDAEGNIMCSRAGLAGVSREVPVTVTLIQDAINLLLAGELAQGEQEAGITTEFPLPGLELKGANLDNGVLTLEFLDPNNKTSGGSCRAGILWFQIEATAKQFPEVSEVRFIPETLFQP